MRHRTFVGHGTHRDGDGRSTRDTPSEVWWAHQDSNLGPIDYESSALTN